MPSELIKKTKQITFSIFVPCKRCRQSIPVNGPFEQVICPDCNSTQDLKPKSFARALNMASMGLLIGSGAQELDVNIYDAPGPTCKNCNESFPVLKHIKEIEKAQKIECSYCHSEITYHEVPKRLKKLMPNAGFIISDKEENLVERKILFQCISCGAGLESKTGDERLMTCKYCGRIMYLSDDAWRLLHSADISRPWSVTYDKKWIKARIPKKVESKKDVLTDPKLALLSVSFYDFCLNCGSFIPINGPARTIMCQECETIHKIDYRLLADCTSSSSRGSRILLKGKTIPSKIYSFHEPQCHFCDEPIEIFEYVKRGNYTDPIICGNCGNELPQFPVPDWFRKYLPKAIRLFGAVPEAKLQELGQTKEIRSMSFVMSCETCGTEIKQTADIDTSRIILCENCKTSSMIPIDIWRRLHPMRLLNRWTLLYEAPELKRKVYLRERIHDYFTWDLQHFLEDIWEKTPSYFKSLINRLLILYRTRVLSFVIKLKCRHCGSPVYVNGPIHTLRCSACMKELNITPYRFAHKLYLASKNIGEKFNTDYVVKFWRKSILPCNECSAYVKIPVSKLASGRHVEITCPECNAVIKGGPPPNWLKEILPNISGIFNGLESEHKEPASVTEQESTSMISTDCFGCGKNISINFESKRTVICEACNKEVFIPDKLWRKIHPITRSQRWAVIFRGSKLAEPDESHKDIAESYY